MPYPNAAWEEAMTVQEVRLNALSGELHWFRVAEKFGVVAAKSAALARAVRSAGLCRAGR
jgi:hypothetical protein